MDAAVRPATPPDNGSTIYPDLEHPFVVPASDVGPSRELSSQFPNAEQLRSPRVSTDTLPRVASVHLSQNGSRNDIANSSSNVLGDRPPNEPEPENDSSRSFSGDVLRGDSIIDQDVIVLTPSRLRLDSRVVLAHATLQWLTNAIWAVLIWQKLDGRLNCSWWTVFSPTIINHLLHIPMQLLVLGLANYMVYKQIGPPPPPSATPGLVLQYTILHHVRVRSHRVDWANNAIESIAVFVVKLQFCYGLQRDSLPSIPLRRMFTPIWCCWVITFLLLCFKDRSERMFGSSRDLFFIFLLFVAFKVDDQSTYSWRVVFLVPWMWFSGLMIVAAMVLLLLLFAKVWARPRELLLPIGFLFLLLSSIPQFVSYIALVRRLDDDDSGTSITSIMWPNALSWFLMWLSAGVIAAALRQKETVRDELLARGAVWTAHESVARRLHAQRDEAQRRVDELTEEEVARLVESMMAGKSKPGRLRRVGENLYKRVASLEPALAERAAQQIAAAAPGPTPSCNASISAANNEGAVGPADIAAGGEDGDPEGAIAADQELLPSAAAGRSAGADTAAAAGVGLPSSRSITIGGSNESSTPNVGTGGSGNNAGSSNGSGLGIFRNNRVSPAPLARTVSGQAAAATAPGPILEVTPWSTGSAPGLDSAIAVGAEVQQPTTATAAAVSPADTAGTSPGSRGSIIEAARGRVRSDSNGWLARPGVEGSLAVELELQRFKPLGRDLESGAPLPQNCTSMTPNGGASPRRPPSASGSGQGRSRCRSASSQVQVDSTSTPCPSQTKSTTPSSTCAVTSTVAAPDREISGVDSSSSLQASTTASVPPRQRRGRPAPLLPPYAATLTTTGTTTTTTITTPATSSTAAQSAPATSGGASATGVSGSSSSNGGGDDGGGVPAPAAPTARDTSVAGTGSAVELIGVVADPYSGKPLPPADPVVMGGEAATGGAEAARPSAFTSTRGHSNSSGSLEVGTSRVVEIGEQGRASFICRSPAVLPSAEMELEVPQMAILETGSGSSGPAASDTAAVNAAEAPVGPIEREDVALDRPAAAGCHTPHVEGSSSRATGTSENGGISGGNGDEAAAATSAKVGSAASEREAEPENACVICYDGEATCVFLECGHGGFCRRCAFLLFVRPPNECPTCRGLIDQVVEIEPVAAVGEVVQVK